MSLEPYPDMLHHAPWQSHNYQQGSPGERSLPSATTNIKYHTSKTGGDRRKPENLYSIHKKEWSFLSPLPTIHALLVLITTSSLQSSSNIPFPQGCYWNCFSPFSSQSNHFPYSLWVIREPNEISQSYENNEPGFKSGTGLTLDNSTSPENLHHLLMT